MNIRFIFIRHGQGCHNIITGLKNGGFLRYNDALDFMGQGIKKELALIDPQLTNVGINITKKNAKVLKKVLENRNIKKIDLVLSSALIRTIETAFYTKRVFDYNKRIYVSPFLREVDESSKNPKSEKSRQVIDTIPAYAMKPVSVQQSYFVGEGIIDHISYNYLDPHLRKEPGDITDFINWFLSSRLYKKKLIELNGVNELNILVFTHAGVMHNFTGEGYYNNSGFIVEVDELGKEIKRESLLKEMKKESLFTEYHKVDPTMYCEKEENIQNRCGELCNKLIFKN